MTDSVKAAVELIKIYHYERETVNGTELLSAVETLITAAEKSDAWENSAKAILVANVIYKDVNEELRARIASLEKDRPEVVTVEEMSKHIQAWKFVDAAMPGAPRLPSHTVATTEGLGLAAGRLRLA